MVVIFGWGAGQAQDFGEVAPTTCPRCHNQVFLHHIRSDKKVSLYFIPLAQYGSDEYLACPICHSGLRIEPGQVGTVNRMQATTSAFRRRAITLEAYQPSVDQFWRALGIDPSGQQVLHPTATVPPPQAAPAGAAPSLADRLAGLARLHADGVLTDEEFAAAKRRLLET
jgi:putative oligomerization/nucleic acid binding protein